MPAQRTTDEIVDLINSQFTAFGASMKKGSDAMDSLAGRVMGLEQAFAARSGGGGMFGPARQTWGSQVAAHQRFKDFIASGRTGKVSIPITASITTPSGIEQRDLVAPQRDGIQGLPQQALLVRSLITAVPTTSNLIQFVRQTSRDNQAAPVADAALKPESSLGLELAEAPVRTLAHWTVLPRQTLSDIPDLEALIDGELLFGLGLVEEQQILSGDGTGQNLKGLIPSALPYSAPFAIADENALDVILLAIVQAMQARLPVSGVLLNDITWAQLISLKDGEQRYLSGQGGGPFGTIGNSLWQIPVIPSPSMDRGTALVGAFRMGCRLHDLQEATVEISTEDSDNFRRNLVTIRAERRTALSVRVPDSFVFVDALGEGLSG